MAHKDLELNYENAFPSPYHTAANGAREEGSPGLTKRELIAAMAMQSFIMKPVAPDTPELTYTEIAQAAKSMADHMMRELK